MKTVLESRVTLVILNFYRRALFWKHVMTIRHASTIWCYVYTRAEHMRANSHAGLLYDQERTAKIVRSFVCMRNVIGGVL